MMTGVSSTARADESDALWWPKASRLSPKTARCTLIGVLAKRQIGITRAARLRGPVRSRTTATASGPTDEHRHLHGSHGTS